MKDLSPLIALKNQARDCQPSRVLRRCLDAYGTPAGNRQHVQLRLQFQQMKHLNAAMVGETSNDPLKLPEVFSHE